MKKRSNTGGFVPPPAPQTHTLSLSKGNLQQAHFQAGLYADSHSPMTSGMSRRDTLRTDRPLRAMCSNCCLSQPAIQSATTKERTTECTCVVVVVVLYWGKNVGCVCGVGLGWLGEVETKLQHAALIQGTPLQHMLPTYARLPANDCDRCWHCSMLPHHLLHFQRCLQVLRVRHACKDGWWFKCVHMRKQATAVCN